METKTHNPSFTVSLRGYDREEVDDYIDSLAEAMEQVDDAEEHNRRLQAHINRLNARIKELEDRISSDSPRTGVVVGERIGILLREAEDTATETITRAEARAAEIMAGADAKSLEADEIVRTAVARGEDQGRRIESAARAEAADIVAEAEARATARTRQIEQWAEQVISHTRAEEARMLREQQERKRAAVAELNTLAESRESASSVLMDLRDSLGHALGLIEVEQADGPATMAMTELDSEEPPLSAIAEEAPAEVPAVEAAAQTNSEIDVRGTVDDDDQFEAKFEAWVASGSEDGDERG